MDATPPLPTAPVPPPAPAVPGLTSQDNDHLRLLSIFHYVVAGLAAVFALIFVFHIVMGIAIIVNLIAAALAGVLIPLALDRFEIDPAVASGPFVTTVTDMVGFFAFLGVATLWFGLG